MKAIVYPKFNITFVHVIPNMYAVLLLLFIYLKKLIKNCNTTFTHTMSGHMSVMLEQGQKVNNKMNNNYYY